MASTRAPKQWCLTKVETVNSFESWKQNLQYTLSLDKNFAQFLVNGVTWERKTKTSPLRGFVDDGEDVQVDQRSTAHQKVNMLELMLGQIANYCPIISRNTILKNSTSIDTIWQSIRTHYGFQSTGAHFIDFSDIRLEPQERPEDLYQRIVAFVEDNLLQKDGSITHHGEQPTEDEELSPSLENLVVLTWLRLIDKNLPRIVKQRYGTELRSKTLSSIKPEISQALDSLIDELKVSEDARIMRAAPSDKSRHVYTGQSQSKQSSWKLRPRSNRLCPLCKQAGRSEYQHFLSSCSFLPESDRRFLTKARQISAQDDLDNSVDESEQLNDEEEHNSTPSLQSSNRRVQTKQSPNFKAFYRHYPVRIVVDSGAETNMIRASLASYIGAKVIKSSQIAVQADGQSQLNVVGETSIKLFREGREFSLEALVVESLDVDILGGVPFMDRNDISVRPARHQIMLADGTCYNYGSGNNDSGQHSIRRAHAYLLRASATTTIWPGEYLEISVPEDISHIDSVALEPRTDSHSATRSTTQELWPHPHITSSVGTKIRIPNMTNEPKVLSKDEHFCQIHQVFSPMSTSVLQSSEPPLGAQISALTEKRTSPASLHSAAIQLDPDKLLTDELRSKFRTLLDEFDDVFDPKFKGYNGAYGPFESVVNMGPVQPPQRKGRVPQYSRDKLVELQQKIDELEEAGVFRRPEDAGIVVEYLNPSFLVKKPSGGYRLVTAFADVGRYSKPQPSLMPDVDSTLRTIACWKYIVTSDLTSAFYQIPLSQNSMKYCGIVSPFRGVRVYARSAMGMPGSETALEELMCRVLGDLLQDGIVAKLADDLYCGGDSPNDLLENWRRVLDAFHKSGIKLSAHKTVIAPKSINILGWMWSQGTIYASPHRISTLATCSNPTTVCAMRSFIGAYKVLARVIPDCATLLAPLEAVVAGRQSQEKISWSDNLYAALSKAQSYLSSNKSIILPRPDDPLWIVTDGSVKRNGVGATMYVIRDEKPRLAGFFSAKLRQRQVTWMPCEIEALSISAAIKHFSPYIIQSKHSTSVLTDSKPCVQAFEKLARGEFSSSPRVSTFLTTVSRYQVSIQHIAGSANIPSDFASRNAPNCNDPECQICRFIIHTEESVVRHVSLHDIISGNVKLPFTSRAAWAASQLECPDLRRTHAHLMQGTRPSKKLTNIKDVKRYLNVVTISNDGLLVVKRSDPMSLSRESIVVPRQAIDGLVAALHIKLDHPTHHQLKLIVHRYFYALDLDKTIDRISNSCHLCASLKKIPKSLTQQTSTDPPEAFGISFAADVIKRERQLIFVIRETVTSFTSGCLLADERSDSLRDAIIQLCIELCPLDGPNAVIRTDPAPGFTGLVNDETLQRHRISLEIGRVKNINKNPVAERAIQEVEDELLRQDPSGGPVSQCMLSTAIARLNSRVRNQGLSARELWTRRDQFTNDQLPICDSQIIIGRHDQRLQNHSYSERSKAPIKQMAMAPQIDVGDLVYLHSDRNKSRARDRYLVISVDGDWCNIRKFTGSQLRRMSYRVKRSECYIVPADPILFSNLKRDTNDSDDEADSAQYIPHPIPIVPAELSLPNHIDLPCDSMPINDLQTVPDSVPVELKLTDPVADAIPTVPDSLSVQPRRSSRKKCLPKYLDIYKT